MRKVALIGTALVFGLTSTAWAGAKDKSSQTFVDIDAEGVINNTTAKTKTKSKGCTLQAQMQTVNMADGDIAICIAAADVLGIGGNMLIMTGEAKAGKLKIKADISEVTVAGQGCGSIDAVSYNGSLDCYLDDATFRGDANIPGSWRAACANIGGTLASPEAGGASKLKENDTVPVVVGLCQSFVVGARFDPLDLPANRFAVQGQRTAAE